MDQNPRDLRFQSHELFSGVTGLMVQVCAQAAGSSIGNNIRIGIALGTLAVNVVMAPWVAGGKRVTKWKTFIYNLTRIVPVYLSYAMLMPEWFTWLGFPIICIILTILVFREEIKEKLTGPYKKCVDVINNLRDKLPKHQVPANVVV